MTVWHGKTRVPLAFAIGALITTAVLAQVPTVGGTWETLAPMPDRRTEVSVTTDGERLFVLGGFTPRLVGASAPLPVYSYDPATDTWSRLTDLPDGVNHASLVYLDGSLYVVGGYRRATFRPVDRLMIYGLAGGEWREGPPLPTARGALAVAVLDGRIHAIGGELTNGNNTGVHEIYDPVTNSWTSAAPMPTVRNHHAAATVGNEIIVIAGRNGQTSTMTVNEIYGASTDTWRTGTDVPTGRSGVAAVSLGRFVYLFGGEQFTVQTGTFDEAERYDPAANSWARLPNMPTARHGLGAAVVDGLIYVISGGPTAGFAFSDLNERLTPDTANQHRDQQ